MLLFNRLSSLFRLPQNAEQESHEAARFLPGHSTTTAGVFPFSGRRHQPHHPSTVPIYSLQFCASPKTLSSFSCAVYRAERAALEVRRRPHPFRLRLLAKLRNKIRRRHLHHLRRRSLHVIPYSTARGDHLSRHPIRCRHPGGCSSEPLEPYHATPAIREDLFEFTASTTSPGYTRNPSHSLFASLAKSPPRSGQSPVNSGTSLVLILYAPRILSSN